MHIVDVCAFYAPQGGGVKTYVERKLRAGLAMGHAITIVAPGREPEIHEFAGGGRIVTVAGRRFPLDGRYSYFHDEPALHATLDELAPDFVEASSPWSSAAMVARWPGSAPRALVMHADPLATYAYRWFEPVFGRTAIDWGLSRFWDHLRRLDEGFDLVVTAAGELAGRLQDGGLRHVVTVPMGVEPGIFSPDLRDEDLRARLLGRCGLQGDATLILAVGRHAGEKRWPMVIDAVTAAGIDHPLALVLVGDGRDRLKVVQSARANPHILFLAPMTGRKELATLMASADLLVHGCESETFCMVASEARASGLPIIAPDRGGAADHALPGLGHTFRAGDAQSLARTIRAHLSSDPSATRARTRAASGLVRSMDRHFSDLFALYGQCPQRGHGLPSFMMHGSKASPAWKESSA